MHSSKKAISSKKSFLEDLLIIEFSLSFKAIRTYQKKEIPLQKRNGILFIKFSDISGLLF
jgi:hypothetical protein